MFLVHIFIFTFSEVFVGRLLVPDPVVFADLPQSLIVCIHGLVAVSLWWIDAIHRVPYKNMKCVLLSIASKYWQKSPIHLSEGPCLFFSKIKQAAFTFSGWGSAGVCSGAEVSVPLHAAGTAPAAPAPPAGPHTACWAAGVWTRLTHSAAASLCRALASRTSRTRTCWTSTRPVRLDPSLRKSKAAESSESTTNRLVWEDSLNSAQMALIPIWCRCSSGSCCEFHWCYDPRFSSQVWSPSLESQPHCAPEHYGNNQRDSVIKMYCTVWCCLLC